MIPLSERRQWQKHNKILSTAAKDGAATASFNALQVPA